LKKLGRWFLGKQEVQAYFEALASDCPKQDAEIKKRLHFHATVSAFKSRQCRFAGILNQEVQVGHS
jgi:hypothetical protein